MFNPVITMTAGWSPVIEDRARRLLAYPIGTTAGGAPVTVAAAFAHAGRAPEPAARLLMHLPPLQAVDVLSDTLAGFAIEREPCPDPGALARTALAHAGRVVSARDAHPERALLAALLRRVRAALRKTRAP